MLRGPGFVFFRPVLAVVFLAALACWPLRDAIWTQRIAGAGPDVLATTWGMWWFSQEWASGAWGAHTELVNFPAGATGAVLSPITATIWSLLSHAVGVATATTWTDIVYLFASLACVALLARATGLRGPFAVVAGALVVLPRYPIYAIGETSLVGITGLTVPLGAFALYRAQTNVRWNVLFALCVGVTGIEMPYLVPVLPVIALARFRTVGTVVACAAGGVILAIFASLHAHSQSAAFGMMSEVARVRLGPWKWLVIEAPWARSNLIELVVPADVRWSLNTHSTEYAMGRDYLGVSSILLCLVCLYFRPGRWGWVALGAVAVALATGSDWGGYPAPFALLNGLCWRLVRGLTQPTRYLLVSAFAFAIAGAHALEAAWARSRLLGGLLLAFACADAALFGGLSLRLPTMTFPSAPCVAALRSEGPGGVLLWPWDGLRVSDEGRQREYQMLHEHPTPGFGVGSWQMNGAKPAGQLLEGLGWEDAAKGRGPLDLAGLRKLGFRWVIVDIASSTVVDTQRWFGAPISTCEGVSVHRL